MADAPIATLESIQKRVLWLSALMVHHANSTRPNLDGTKVGGHQASSSSVVGLMTALYFHALRPGDIVATKAHASPILYAIEYLRGRLTAEQLRGLRSLGALQAYPSRRKNPEIIDVSTGSMGLGAVSAAFGALAARYVSQHGGAASPSRFIAMVGDAELDEGNVWEGLLEEAVRELDNLLWIVDVNRQSLDRVVPDARRAQLREWFRGAGWHVIELRWGGRLRARFGRPGGERLRARLEGLGAAEYQALLRLPAGAARKAVVATREGETDAMVDRLLADVPDETLGALLADVGGHDLAAILAAYDEAAQPRRGPCVILADTVKGWGYPFAADQMNHGTLLTQRQLDELRESLGVDPADEWAGFAAGSAEATLVRGAPAPYAPPAVEPAPEVPDTLEETYPPQSSTQEAFGRVLGGLDHPQGRLLPARQAGLRRGRSGDGAVEGVAGRPARRARHRRAQSLPRARGLRPRPRAVGPDAPAHRHALRSLREPRARRALPRALRGRALYRGRDPVRGEPLAGGRSAPVGDHARHRGGAARDPVLRAHVRPGGGVDPARGAAWPAAAWRRGEPLPASLHQADRSGAGARAVARASRGGAAGRLPLDRRARAARLRSGRQCGAHLRGRRDGARGGGREPRAGRDRDLRERLRGHEPGPALPRPARYASLRTRPGLGGRGGRAGGVGAGRPLPRAGFPGRGTRRPAAAARGGSLRPVGLARLSLPPLRRRRGRDRARRAQSPCRGPRPELAS